MNRFFCVAFFAIGFAPFVVVHAADVEVNLSARETYVGKPIVLTIQVVNATRHEPPKVPDVDGVTIEGGRGASRQSSITINNGRMRPDSVDPVSIPAHSAKGWHVHGSFVHDQRRRFGRFNRGDHLRRRDQRDGRLDVCRN